MGSKKVKAIRNYHFPTNKIIVLWSKQSFMVLNQHISAYICEEVELFFMWKPHLYDMDPKYFFLITVTIIELIKLAKSIHTIR